MWPRASRKAFAFDARISLARHAEKSLDVQYYLIQNDEAPKSGRLLLHSKRGSARRWIHPLRLRKASPERRC